MEQRPTYKTRSLIELTAAIRDRRAILGWTQQDLAEKIHMSRKWVSDMERGKPTVEILPLMRAISAVGLEIELALETKDDHAKHPQRIRRRSTGGLVRGKQRSDNF